MFYNRFQVYPSTQERRSEKERKTERKVTNALGACVSRGQKRNEEQNVSNVSSDNERLTKEKVLLARRETIFLGFTSLYVHIILNKDDNSRQVL
jgi:hypothetical protein